MKTALCWLRACAQHALSIRSPSLGRVVPWPWDRGPHEIDLDGVIDVARKGH